MQVESIENINEKSIYIKVKYCTNNSKLFEQTHSRYRYLLKVINA